MHEYPNPPKFEEPSFICPYCKALAEQRWFSCTAYNYYTEEEGMAKINNNDVYVSICHACNNAAFWETFETDNGKMIYPNSYTVSLPNNDLNEEIKKIYDEAASIANLSPRAACALLRLAVQMLLKQLGEKGDNINEDIKNMVAKEKISPKIQKALDFLRVTGNHAVHPGQIDFDEAADTLSLFDWINIIADDLITKPKRINEAFNSLPKKDKESIKKRDKELSKK